MHKPVAGLAFAIPPLIKRNTLLLALSQSFIGAAAQLAYGIGPLMVIAVDWPPAVAILADADASGIDLIALETRGRSGLAKMLLGSVADKVVRYAL